MPIVNPAHQFLNYPKKQVGTYALDIAQLADNSIPLPITYCIPVTALKTIAEDNHLETKFAQIRKATNLDSAKELEQTTDKTQKLIKDQAVPDHVAKEILKLYQEKLDKDFIRLIASPVDGKKIDYKREDNIKGDTNMIESILKLWARNIDPSDIKESNLFPVAIVIQAQTQPDVSGVAYSLNIQNGDKSKISIYSVFGVYDSLKSEKHQDVFVIDERNWQISSQLKGEQTHILVRHPDELQLKLKANIKDRLSLSQNQVKKLAKLIRAIKLQRPNHIKIHWELLDGEFIITKIKPYHHSFAHQVDKAKYETILLGLGLTSGFINGRCQIIQNDKKIDQALPGMIAVVKTLNNKHHRIIQNSQAIICEQPIRNQEILNLIREYQLPTIANVRDATQELKDNQLITLDAAAGKIYHQKNKKVDARLTLSTKPNLLLSVNNFDEITEEMIQISGGIGLLRSENFLVSAGSHPKKILNSKPEEFLNNVVQDCVNFYHRFIHIKKTEPIIVFRSNNLNSNQMLRLDSGSIYEKQEPNPFLGFRGGIRLINQKKWLEFEIEIISKINNKIDKPVNFLLPFVRTPFELRQLYQIIENSLGTIVQQPPLWFQITTPENLANIEEYLQQFPLSGVSVHLKTLHALMLGIDPNYEDVFEQYGLNNNLLIPKIKQAIEKIKKHDKNIKINLILPFPAQELVNLTKQLNINGITVRPELALPIKQELIKLKNR